MRNERKAILRQMGSKPDPQLVYAKLWCTATNSTAARIKASNIISEFNPIQSSDGSTEPGAKKFVEHVQNLFKQHDQLKADPAEFLSDTTKKKAMSHAVQSNNDMRQVAFRDKDSTKIYTCEKYLQHIRNAADNYDAFMKSFGEKAACVRFTHTKSMTQWRKCLHMHASTTMAKLRWTSQPGNVFHLQAKRFGIR